MQGNMINQNIIITEPSSNLRALGRNSLAGKWKIAILAVLIYLIVILLPQTFFDAMFGTNVGSVFTNSGYTYGIDADFYASAYNVLPKYSAISVLYLAIVTGPLELGLAIFFLATFRKHNVKSVDVFLGFEKFGKAIGLYWFQALFIFLWSLLFVVPGIIAAIRYSQAFFILADDPTKGIRQCMNESKAMMKGNKAKYFCLSLSFIGWIILAAIPAGIIQGIGNVVTSNDFVLGLFVIISELVTIPVVVYQYSAFAGFYEILAGHLIKETSPVPVTVEEAQAIFGSSEVIADTDKSDANDEMSADVEAAGDEEVTADEELETAENAVEEMAESDTADKNEPEEKAGEETEDKNE